MPIPMGDLDKEPLAKRTRSQRTMFFEEEHRRIWGNSGGTDDSGRVSSMRGGFVNRRGGRGEGRGE